MLLIFTYKKFLESVLFIQIQIENKCESSVDDLVLPPYSSGPQQLAPAQAGQTPQEQTAGERRE
jgi:hypothetical protein